MYTQEAVIPQYLFEPDAETGNPDFRINHNDCVTNYRRNDFLVPHRKGYYFMAFVRNGSSRHWVDTMPYIIKPDRFYFTTPHQVNLKEDSKPFTGITLSFTEEFLSLDESGSLKKLPIIQNPDNGHELILTAENIAFIDDLLNKIYAESFSKNSWQQSMLLAYMKVLLIYLSRLYTEQLCDANLLPGKRLLQLYLKKIDEWFTRFHDVAAYADMLNLTAGHLGDTIKGQSGKPAIAHIHERLMLEAKTLLFHTENSIKEIAFKLGFDDASYFNRFFKRIAGQTPVSYRNTIRKMYH